MAKTKSHLLSDLSGSTGGVTYQSDSAGNSYIRSKPIRCRRHCSGSSISKSRFSRALQRWAIIPESSRSIWNETFSPIYGRLSFIKFYIKALIIQESGLFSSVLLNPPTTPTPLAYKYHSFSPPPPGQSGFRLYFENPNPFNVYQFAYISRGFSSSRNRLYHSYLTGISSANIILANSTRRLDFLNLVPNRKYWVKCQCLSLLPENRISKTLELMFTAQ